MFREAHALVLPVVLALLSGPIGFAASSASKSDTSDLYVVVGSRRALDDLLVQPGAREIGPYRAPFARIVQTSSDFHASLVSQGYWVFPASSLAELCGIRLVE